MADTGYNWGSWAFVQKGAADWDNDALADDACETSDAISLDGKAACIVSVQAVEDGTGAINGNCTIAILSDTEGTANNYEDAPGLAGAQVGSPFKFQFLPVQNDTVCLTFGVDPRFYDSFKIAVLNEGGQELALDVRYKTATVPVAS